MSCPALTNKGGKLYISEGPVDCDLTLSGLAVLDYVLVPGVGSIGDTGVSQDVVTYPVYGSGLTPQGKGDAVGIVWEIDILDAPSAGRDILELASQVDNHNLYATKIEWADGDVELSINKVVSPTYVKAGGSSVRVVRYSFVPVIAPIVTPYSLESVALFEAMSPEPDESQMAAIDNFMRNGLLPIWGKSDAFYVYHSYADQPSRVNWRNPSEESTAVGAPIFIPYSGWEGDGIAAHLVIPTALNAYTLNSAHLGSSQADPMVGVAGNIRVGDSTPNLAQRGVTYAPRNTSNNRTVQLNQSTASVVASTEDTLLTILNRQDSSSFYIYDGDNDPIEVVSESNRLPAMPITPLHSGVGDIYGSMIINICFFGGGLTHDEALALNAAWQTYKDEMSAPEPFTLFINNSPLVG